MKPLGNSMDHYWHVIDMAGATDVDLVAAMDAAELDDQEWAAMVQRCRGCEWVNGCDRFLTEREGKRAVPETCVNAHIFRSLQSRQSEPV